MTACTCPWNQNPVEPKRGHRVSCPSLEDAHTPDDECDSTYAHIDKKELPLGGDNWKGHVLAVAYDAGANFAYEDRRDDETLTAVKLKELLDARKVWFNDIATAFMSGVREAIGNDVQSPTWRLPGCNCRTRYLGQREFNRPRDAVPCSVHMWD